MDITLHIAGSPRILYLRNVAAGEKVVMKIYYMSLPAKYK